jgi:hypothetical protein
LQEITLVGAYKEAYKRQMDMYQWIMRQNGFNVSNTGYFVYVNGDQHFEDGMLRDKENKADMSFEVQLLSYEGSEDWVEAKVIELKSCLLQTTCPEHVQTGNGSKGDEPCEYFTFLKSLNF